LGQGNWLGYNTDIAFTSKNRVDKEMNSWHTSTLPLSEARNLHNHLKKSKAAWRWSDFGGEGGVLSEITFDNYSAEQVRNIQIPDYCPCFTILGRKEIPWNELPEIKNPCGRDWKLWEKGGRWSVKVTFYSKKLQRPVMVALKTDNEGDYYRPDSKIRASTEIEIHWNDLQKKFLPKNEKKENLYRKKSDPELIRTIKSLIEKYFCPNGQDIKILESAFVKQAGFARYTMNFGSPWAINTTAKLIRELSKNNEKRGFTYRAEVSQGGFSTICLGPENINLQVEDMVSRFLDHGSYDSIKGNYSIIKPEDWRAREKRRKKWKKPMVQELGSLHFKKSGEADVKICIEKEGYIFYLDFDSEDSAFAFPDSPLFKKADWHSETE